MKRILLPLLAAIALPTAVNANWLSRDLVWTNSVGEKTIIKKETIGLEKLTVNKQYKLIRIETNKKLAKYDRQINRAQEGLDDNKRYYAECLLEYHPKHKYERYGSVKAICDLGFSSIGKNINLYEKKIDKNKLIKKNYSIRSKKKLLNYENWNGTGNEVINTTISYTPIFEDLNGIKTVGYRKRVVCDNPFIDFSSLKISGGNKGLSSLERKICKKYAKFK